MNNHKRYTAAGSGVVRTNPKGDLVLYTDYARLKAEVERSRDQYNGIIDTQLKVIEELKAEVERLTKAGDAMASPLSKGAMMTFGYELAREWNAAKQGGQP